MSGDTVGFDQVLEAELRRLISRREALEQETIEAEQAAAATAQPAPQVAPFEPPPSGCSPGVAQHFLQQQALRRDLCGLTISGGGIRSATFGLGILQGLAAEGMLERIDYLSTVSGGGYIGSWLTAWIREIGVRKVSEKIRPSWFDGTSNATYVETGELRHLRLYSNYLSPRLALTSLDGWVLIAIYVRNLLLNQVVLLLGACACFLALRSVVEVYTIFHAPAVVGWPIRAWVGVCAGLCAAALIYTYRFARDALKKERVDDKLSGLSRLLGLYLATAIAASLLFVSREAVDWFSRERLGWTVLEFAMALGALHAIIGHALGSPCEENCRATRGGGRDYRLKGSLFGLLAGSLCGLAAALVFSRLVEGGQVVRLAVAGVPLFLVMFVLGNFLQIGLMGRHTDAYARERWSSLNAWLISRAALWLVVMGAVVYGPWLILLLTNPILVGELRAQITGWILGGSWVGATWAALTASNSPRTSGSKSHLGELVARAGPAVFLLGLLIALSYFLTWAVYGVHAYVQEGTTVNLGLRAMREGYLENLEKVQATFWLPLSDKVRIPFYPLSFLLSALVLFAWTGVWAAKQIGVNVFSLHELYALRLIRCFLGAIRFDQRLPSLITNYDAGDDMPLSQLQRKAADPKSNSTGPLQILCAAVNRRYFGGSESTTAREQKKEQVVASRAAEQLAFQDRKADSFIFTADYCGSESTGYCPTSRYAEDISLGTAMAISGAAVSPNSGYHSASDVGALLTIFNLRLGAWLGNPGNAKSRQAANPSGWNFLYRELIGDVNAEDEFIYVSDGGHFENMGVYELVRRRCRFIIAVDTWADPEMTRENLGRLVRTVRIDFGVRIEIDVEGTRAKDGRCQSHIAVGKIHYGDVHSLAGSQRPVFNNPRYDYEANEGVLVYIKMGLTGDEPNDLLNYQAENPDFPHHPISDQFFDEAQFESYRALGLHSARVLMQGDAPRPGEAGTVGPRESNRDIFTRIYQRWLAPPPHLMDSYTRYNEVYAELLAKLRGDTRLRNLAWELYGDPPEKAAARLAHREAVEQLAERLIVGEMCALIENVWFGVDLERHILHPVHEGWLNVFRNWTTADTFWRHWITLKKEFSPGTRKVMDGMRNALYESLLHPVSRDFIKDEKLAPLCRQLGWETATPGYRDPVAEKRAVELLACTFQEIWPRIDSAHNPDDSLVEPWRGVWRGWLESPIFAEHWRAFDRPPPY